MTASIIIGAKCLVDAAGVGHDQHSLPSWCCCVRVGDKAVFSRRGHGMAPRVRAFLVSRIAPGGESARSKFSVKRLRDAHAFVAAFYICKKRNTSGGVTRIITVFSAQNDYACRYTRQSNCHRSVIPPVTMNYLSWPIRGSI